MHERLVDRSPVVPADQLVAQMVPPPMFDEVSFASYIPDPERTQPGRRGPTAEEFAKQGHEDPQRRTTRPVREEDRRPPVPACTSTAASASVRPTCWPRSSTASRRPSRSAPSCELTHVVGALGFNKAVERLSDHSVLCIDEFELDDPGDTMLVSRLLSELSARGVSIVATSNTLPGQLGEGRSRLRTSCARSRSSARSSRRFASTAPTTVTAICRPHRSPISSEELVERADGDRRRDARRLRRAVQAPQHAAPVALQQAGRGREGGLHRRRPPGRRISLSRCAWWFSPTACTTRASRSPFPGRKPRRDLHPGDARRWVPEEVPARDLASARTFAFRGRGRLISRPVS